MMTVSQRGFTLIELLIVVLIIGILSGVAIPVFNGQRTKAKNTAAKAALRNAYTATRSIFTTQENYYNNFNSDMPAYPSGSPAEFPGESSLKAIQWNSTGPNPANGKYPPQESSGKDAQSSNIITVYALWPNSAIGGPYTENHTSALLCNTGKGDRSFCILDVPIAQNPAEFPVPVGVYYGQSNPDVNYCTANNIAVPSLPSGASVGNNSIANAYCNIASSLPKSW